MAKIATAQVEIKPVLNEDALDEVCARLERRISEAIARGLSVARGDRTPSSRGR